MSQSDFLRRATLAFSAGALGALLMTLLLWLLGAIGIAGLLHVKIAPALERAFLYRQIVWGGIWGFTMLLPICRGSWLLRGLLLGLAATVVLVFVVLPIKAPQLGTLALGLGTLAPIYFLVIHLTYGLITAWWYDQTAEKKLSAA